jgi:hypothetical protein
MTAHEQTVLALWILFEVLAAFAGVVIGYHLRPRGRGRGRS